MPADATFYRLASGVDVVRLPDGNALLRSDTAVVRLEGESASLIVDEVFPLLDGRRPLPELSAALKGVNTHDLEPYLEQLVEKGLVRRSTRPLEESEETRFEQLGPALSMLEDLGLPPNEARHELAQRSVAIVGLEGPGAYAASHLAQIGIGKLLLADPYPCEPGNIGLFPPLGREVVGLPRQEVVRDVIAASGRSVETIISGKELSREEIAELCREADLILACFDRGFAATNVWVNQVSLERGILALYGRLQGHAALLGPLVIPDNTACYMCWRMRALACEDAFEEAMAYEEFLDQRRRPGLHERSVLPFLSSSAGSILATQALVSLLDLTVPTLAGRILEFNALTLASELHPLLQKPDCPACSKKKTRTNPTFAQLNALSEPHGDLLTATERLIGRRFGVIKDLREVRKDASEPARPYVYRAQLANLRFVEESGDELVASGKGMTHESALKSALGEAVERYSSMSGTEDGIVVAPRPKLQQESLDPRALVLYHPEQYADLAYAPYREDTPLGWLSARDLTNDREILVPALAVSMAYHVHSSDEFLFGPSSNGLAAGPSLVGAILAGALEVIERDAFLITWYARLPCQAVDPATHPDGEIRGLARAYARRGVSLRLFSLPVDHPVHVFMALAIAGDGEPAAVAGLGADLDPVSAAAKAALEVGQVRPALRLRLRDPKEQARLAELVGDPHEVSSLQDHDLLYASRALLPAFDFLPLNDLVPLDWRSDALGAPVSEAPLARLTRIVTHFRDVGQDLLYRDLTPPDMQAFGLHTVRVLAPGFQPIDFGWKERRLGGTRLFDLPRRLGFTAAPLRAADLNDLPHPLA